MFGRRRSLSGRKERSVKPILLFFVILVIAVPLIWLFFVRMEGTAPIVEFESEPFFIGSSSTDLTVTIKDSRSGIRKVWMGIIAGDREVEVLQQNFPSGGFFVGGKEKSVRVTAQISPEELGLADGKAVLKIEARDYSLRHWGKGNPGSLEKEIEIDTTPPSIRMVSRAHNIAQGGAGLVIYRLAETCPKSGVMVGEEFYPGYGGYFSDPTIHLAFFAMDYRADKTTRITITAQDAAGNQSSATIAAHILPKTFRKDSINLSDSFLSHKMPDFERFFPELAKGEPLELFLAVNQELRDKDDAAVAAITTQTEKNILWEGPFLRLPGSADRAQFADSRTYYYGGKIVDHQHHMGIDLASTTHAQIPAANHGKVVFAGDQGIYGNTVIIDHGFGLMSLYSHMSHIEVAVGDSVQKGHIIGRTGATGMAGGDHLHYTTLVHHTFTNPIEWWDPAWIKNNITSKIEEVGP
ncbi:M23 family metallopeptidase [Desulfosarcina sp. OttesenSCG-928-A07]|nr:M23 family metallopeptidase [Desulfosarcina sp. OttesenSCG-928-G17]MDL2329544.1 M23 family metallopeptidase [Desulfosarcina sp. OttesenSCG-928-A07]